MTAWLSLVPLALLRRWRPWRARATVTALPHRPEAEPEGAPAPDGPEDVLLVELGRGVASLGPGLASASAGRIRAAAGSGRRDALLLGPIGADAVRALREEHGPRAVLVIVDVRGAMPPATIAEAFRSGASDVISGADLPVLVARLEALFRRHRG